MGLHGANNSWHLNVLSFSLSFSQLYCKSGGQWCSCSKTESRSKGERCWRCAYGCQKQTRALQQGKEFYDLVTLHLCLKGIVHLIIQNSLIIYSFTKLSTVKNKLYINISSLFYKEFLTYLLYSIRKSYRFGIWKSFKKHLLFMFYSITLENVSYLPRWLLDAIKLLKLQLK